MLFSKKYIVTFTVVNTFLVGLALSVSQTPGLARMAQNSPIQRTPVQPQIQPNTNFGVSPDFKGNWKGNLHAKGDDALTILEIVVFSNSGSNYQGTWKHHGSKYDAKNDTWEDTILQQGTLKASRQGNEVTLELNGFNGKKLVLSGTLTPSKISGEVVGFSNFVFSFAKQ